MGGAGAIEPDDATLLAAWAKGDTGAGTAFIRRYGPLLWRYFSNKLSSEVEDAMQTTMASCVQYRERLVQAKSPRAYVLSIARNHLFAIVRGRGSASPYLSSIASTEASPSSAVHRRRQADALRRAVRELPLVYQEALELHYWEGLKGSELSEALGVPEGTMRSRLRRARLALSQRMAGAGDDRPRQRAPSPR